MSTTDSGPDNPTDDVPDGWTPLDDDMQWRRDDGALLRIHSRIPTRSAAECNAATHSDATGQYAVLFHERPLPSTPEEIDTVGTETAARLEAQKAMEERA